MPHIPCGWHITRTEQDVYSRKFKVLVKGSGWLGRLFRFVDLDEQVEAYRRVVARDTRWIVVHGSAPDEGESQGLPVWSRHVGDPIPESNIARRVDRAASTRRGPIEAALAGVEHAICVQLDPLQNRSEMPLGRAI